MIDKRILITIEKVGQKINSAIELDVNLINGLAEEIQEWNDYKDNSEDYEFLYSEEVYGEIRDNCLEITLKDGSNWNIVTTWTTEQQCIKHCLFHNSFDNERYIFESKDEDNLYLCDECKTFGKKHPEILNKYLSCIEYADKWIFPREWTDEGIEAWCKKRENKQKDYENKQEERFSARQERVRLDGDCSTCCNMKHGECKYGNDQDENFEFMCDDYEEM